MNTAIAALMSLMNSIYSTGKITADEYKIFITLLNPFAPHITEEIWEMCGFDGMLNAAKWPEFDESKCVDSTVEIVVQVNGKIRARLNVAADINNADAIALAKSQEAIISEISDKTIIKELYVPKKLVNIVVK
jgi:leucyl-tRNA synthetase